MSYTVLHPPAFPVVGIDLEEVAIQYVAKPRKDFSVHPLALEKVIDVLPRAAQLAGQPRHGALLPGEFGFDKVTDMWGFVRGHVLVIWM